MSHSPRFRVMAACIVAGLALTPISPQGALADPVGDKRAEAERIAAQLERETLRLSVLTEDLNEARLEAAERERAVVEATDRLADTDARADRAKRRLRDQAVAAYVMGGSARRIELFVRDLRSDDVGIRQQYVETVTADSRDLVDELRAVRLRLGEEHAALATARADSNRTLAEVAGRQEEAATAEAAQRATLSKVRGELASLVQAEARRRAEAEARKAREELAARRAREEAAAAARRATTTTSIRPAPRTGSSTTVPRSTTTTTIPRPAGDKGPPPARGADTAVAEAKRQIGKPYEYGSPGPDSFDCSGLTSWAWRAGGRTLPHSSRAQWSATTRVGLDALVPGDILFYGPSVEGIHHVGIYAGDGQMVEASQTGTPVRMATIYRRDLVGAGRVT